MISQSTSIPLFMFVLLGWTEKILFFNFVPPEFFFHWLQMGGQWVLLSASQTQQGHSGVVKCHSPAASRTRQMMSCCRRWERERVPGKTVWADQVVSPSHIWPIFVFSFYKSSNVHHALTEIRAIIDFNLHTLVRCHLSRTTRDWMVKRGKEQKYQERI